MFFKKNKPKRLYLPAKSKWYARPRPQKRQRFWVRGKKKVEFKRQWDSFKNKWIYWILGTFISLFLGLFLFFSTYLSISKIQVVRQDFNVNSAAIEEILKPYIGKNLLFFNRDLAVQKVKEKFVEYSEVKVKKILPHTLQIELKSQPLLFNVRLYYSLPPTKTSPENPEDLQKEPVEPSPEEALQAALTLEPEQVPSPQITEQKGMLNAAGQVIFDQEENLELIPLIIKNRTRPMEDRERIISIEKLTAISQTIQRFEDLFEESVEGVEYFPEGREFHLKIDNGMMLWITFQKDSPAQIEKLYSIYKPTGLDQESLAYIDLRVAEKVIYCSLGAACDNF